MYKAEYNHVLVQNVYFFLHELMKKQSTPTSFFCCPRYFYYVSSFCFNYWKNNYVLDQVILFKPRKDCSDNLDPKRFKGNIDP